MWNWKRATLDAILVLAALAIGVWAFELRSVAEIGCFVVPCGAWLWFGHKIMEEPV